MRFFPKLSLLCFFFTGIIYLAQLFPLTGVFLMMLAAPFWSVITINAGFILMTLESLIGAWPRWILIFPFIYFGGYMTLAGASHYEYYSLQKEIEAHNVQVKIPYNVFENDLVLSSQMDTRMFLTTYGLASVYQSNLNFKPKSHRVSIIGDKKSCQSARGIGIRNGFSTLSIRSHDRKSDKSLIGRLGKTVPDICLLKYPQDPQKPIYTVSMTEEKVASWLLPLRQKIITIKGPDAKAYVLKGGFAAPYKWFPMPVMGCALNSAAPSWDCFHGFSRNNFQPLNKGSGRFLGDSWALSKALGLKLVPEQEKYKPKETSINIDEISNSIKKEKKDDAYMRFEELLSDPVSYDKSLNFSGLKPDYLILKSPLIISSLIQLKPYASRRIQNKIQGLSRKLSSMPFHVIKEHEQALFNLFSDSTDYWIRANNALFIRLGDLGPQAHPLLLKLLKSDKSHFHNHFNGTIAYAICRAGDEMAPIVGDLLLKELKEVSGIHQRYATKRSIYLALARIGLRDKADQILTLNDTGAYRAGDELISKSSPATICVNLKGKPIYPD